jgi:hypothetical protein
VHHDASRCGHVAAARLCITRSEPNLARTPSYCRRDAYAAAHAVHWCSEEATPAAYARVGFGGFVTLRTVLAVFAVALTRFDLLSSMGIGSSDRRALKKTWSLPGDDECGAALLIPFSRPLTGLLALLLANFGHTTKLFDYDGHLRLRNVGLTI